MRALFYLTVTLMQRLLRQGTIIRSLVFPIIVTMGAMLMTLVVYSWLRGPPVVAVTEDLDPVLMVAIHQEGWAPIVYEDPRAAVESSQAWAGVEGETMFIKEENAKSLRLERLLRQKGQSSWLPDPIQKLPSLDEGAVQGRTMGNLISFLFTLYGVVFGAGMVARDRDNGTLEAEFSLAVPHWYHGASRWFAGTIVLSAFLAMSITIIDAQISLPSLASALRNGFAANAMGVAVGLTVIGRAGLKRGFSGPIAMGLVTILTLMVLGMTLPPQLAGIIPVASIFTRASGWEAMGISILVGLVAMMGFSNRSTT
ncbi:MAG: hypothetical protein HN348_24710 [Proteobacteria bacterium]|nr:hypothetical protein [Pseudomonadota bacterium]